ncbi:hypothetical protein EHW67_18955 [Arenibacter aquaticus]|uniref:DUF3592 domain-containing protein n=1 Tax=Arenibacter aquaticus TaxID=2489054 RepID=A0A3S0IKJ1_9FLAO|nr:DUF3592 domain-containing protein [Arenibacter aquaticus]RTE52263.1 hypothetical protein EHW67_18955 [Arenibacter aquaticus]
MRPLVKVISILGLTAIIILLILQLIFSCYYLYKPIAILLDNNKLHWEKSVAEIKSVKLLSRPNPNMPKEASMVFPIEVCYIQYTFYYEGNYYTNSNIGLNVEKEYQSKFHRALYMKLKEMDKVIVYINPKNPKQSSIIKYDINLKDIGAGIALLIFPLLIVYWVYIGRKHPPNYITEKIKTIS